MKSYFTKYSGEVAAIVGYEFQYSIFATEIYNALLNENDQIEWVEFASNDAGKLDDVLIGLRDSILAYQVKNIESSAFSYKSFVTSNTKSILEGIYEGWKKIKTNNPGKTINVKFITTQAASQNDKIELYSGTTKPSFQIFLNNLWNPVREGKYNSHNLPEVWNDVVKELLTKTKSSLSELFEFIRSSSLIFEYSQPKLFDAYNERQRRMDIEDITKQIFQTVARHGNKRFTKTEFLECFGLMRRYESYFAHSFFVDEVHYQPINETINQLEEFIKKYNKGYIALIGNAGSGKSTLITKWLQQTNYKILKYYAYVNTEMDYDFGFRGEAKIFLHDLLVQIRQSKQSIQSRLPSENIEDLQKHFTDELNRLSLEREKIIIVVDGLDHIEREQDVTKSLLSILPKKDDIPNNIYFILGSRTIENLDKLNRRIKDSIIEENRVIQIKPLSKDRIQKLLSSYQIILSEDLLEKLFVNTQGHPLFLRYTTEAIRSRDISELPDIISQKIFSGDIYKEYRVFWDNYKLQDDFIEVLGLVARFRDSFFDVTLLNLFNFSRASLHNINKLSEDYFYKTGSVWQFFHNSFKEFLIYETAKDILTNSFDANKNKQFHLKIYNAIRQSASQYKWNNLYHLYKAEEYSAITLLTTQEYFRKQWHEFRSYKLIKEDIQFAISASNQQGNIYSLFRCFLSIFELKQRYNNFNPTDHINTFHQLDMISLANSFVYDNVELLVSQNFALNYSLALYRQEYKTLAYDIFLRATPSYILNQSKSVSSDRYDSDSYQMIDEIKLICAWAKAASLFISIEEIFDRIEGITIEESYQSSERDLFSEVFSEILDISIETTNWFNLKSLEILFLKKYERSDLFYFYFDIVYKLPNENELYSHCLEILNSWEISDNNPINRRLLIVQILIRKDVEKGILIFNELLKPNEIERNKHSTRDEGFLDYIFDYSRFLYITKQNDSIDFITFLPNEEKQTKRALYSAFAELGKSFAYLYYDRKNAAIEYYFNFKKFLGLFHYSHTEYEYEYSVSESKAQLINLVLKISSQLSKDIFDKILEILNEEWEKNRSYWSTSQVHEVINCIIDSKLNNEWCLTQLGKIENYIFEYGYVNERIEKGITQIGLWTKLEQIAKGEEILNYIKMISFDVRGEKDNQLDYIVDWIKLFESDMSGEINYYLQRVNSLRDKVNSSSHTPSKELLSLSLKYGNGFEIFKYILFKGLTSFNDSIELILAYLLKATPKNKNFLLKLFTRIVIAFDNYHYSRHLFLNELFKISPTLSDEELKDLITEFSVYAISEYRNDYLYQIQEYIIKNNLELSSVGLDKKIERNEQYSHVDTDELTLNNGEKISSDQLFENINSINELEEIELKSINRSTFNWSNLYYKIFANSNDYEILTFVKNGKYRSKELADIAEVLINLNKKILAKNLLYQAIQSGESLGWVTFYDGGSKIVPFELLSKIEENDIFQKEILNDFSNSIIDLSIESIETLIKDAPKIWKYFTDDVRYNELYDEIIKFRNELLKTHSLDYSAPSVLGNLKDDELLIEMLFFLITMPSDFNHALDQVIFEETSSSEDIIRPLLQKLFDNGFYLKYLELLAVINIKNKKIVLENKDNIAYLINNRRYDISKIAQRILESIDIIPTEHLSVETRELPFTYNMELDYKPSVFNSKELELDHIDKKGFLKETDDPLVYVRLYLTEIRMLSNETGINVINIAYRIMTLGKDLEFPNWCNSISEEEIRKIYTKLELEISYKRPRNQLVWDGLMKVIKELWELNLIDKSTADELSDEFDEYTCLIETKPQPQFFTSILGKSGDAPSASKEWAKELTDKYLRETITFKTSENHYILAEHSIIRGMGWGHSEEIRQSFIELIPEINFGEHRTIIFNLTSRQRIEDYIELYDRGITLYNGLLTMNKKRNWLAINPLLCKDLGLVFNPNKNNFRWDDKNGNKIIESVYWQIHSTDNYSKNHSSETGYGWYVILYKEGYEIFKELIGDKKLYQHKKISRHMRFYQDRYNTKIEEDFSKSISEKILL